MPSQKRNCIAELCEIQPENWSYSRTLEEDTQQDGRKII